jgi:uncharacterized membrane protein YjjB (DUF3815 family)
MHTIALGTTAGIVVVVAIAAAAVALGFLGHLLIHRFGRTRPETQERRPHRRRRVGRVGS